MQRAVAYTSGMNPRQISIEIAIATRYLEDQSKPDDDRYVFSYTIRLRNVGDEPARLHARHWIITDAKGQTREVRGEGVVGEQPRLEPGQSFEYSSGAVLETECGTMHEVEAAAPGYPVVHDFEPDLEGFYRDWLDRPLEQA